MRMRHIVICGLSGSKYFSTLSHKRHDFLRKKKVEHKMCVLIFSTTFVLNICHSMKRWSKMYTGFHAKPQLFLSDFNGNWIFSTDFRKILKNQISRKPRPMGAKWTDGQKWWRWKSLSAISRTQLNTSAENSWQTSWCYNLSTSLQVYYSKPERSTTRQHISSSRTVSKQLSNHTGTFRPFLSPEHSLWQGSTNFQKLWKKVPPNSAPEVWHVASFIL
jgi:hypothetical protein